MKRQHPELSNLPAKNKAGLNGRLYLPHRITLTGNYRYSDLTRSPDPERNEHVQSYHRLDFAASKKFAGERAELLLGVRDVLDDTAFPLVPIGAISGYETPGRTFFGRFQLKF